MQSPTLILQGLQGRKVILLTGARLDSTTGKTAEIATLDQLVAAARQNPDAVAFGFTAGRWVAGA